MQECTSLCALRAQVMRNLINEIYCLWFACATPVPVTPPVAPGAIPQVHVTAPTSPSPAQPQGPAAPPASPAATGTGPAPRAGAVREKSAANKRASMLQQQEDGPPPPPPVPPTGYANLWRPWDHVYALVTAPKGGKGPPVVPSAALAGTGTAPGAPGAGAAGAGGAGAGAQPAAGGAAASASASQSQTVNATPPAPGVQLVSATPQALPNLQQCVSALYNPAGKYAVKLFFMGCWRKVLVDDNVPFDSFGRPLLPVSTNSLELWPLLLSKALLKIASLECALVASRYPLVFSFCSSRVKGSFVIQAPSLWEPNCVPPRSAFTDPLVVRATLSMADSYIDFVF